MDELKDKIENFIEYKGRKLDEFDDTLVGPGGRAEFYQDFAIDCYNFICDINSKLEEDE